MITRLKIDSFRNLESIQLDFTRQLNVFLGPNGAGKTSLLEAIYLLSHGRSFRSSKLDTVIAKGKDKLTVFAGVDVLGHSIGMEKKRAEPIKASLNGARTKSLSQISLVLPIQSINPNTFRLLEGGPSVRRQLLDWGVFHVEPSYVDTWKQANRVLKQRNSLLRKLKNNQLEHREAGELLAFWDNEFVRLCCLVDFIRKKTFLELRKNIEEQLDALIPLKKLKLEYYPGWDSAKTLEKVLQDALQRDKILGYTGYGFQKADLRFKVGNQLLVDCLSRGQQKLFICALTLAMAGMVGEHAGKKTYYLVDDLSSELDAENQKRLLATLVKQGEQVFITSLERSELYGEATRFHVEQGMVSQFK